MAVQNQESGAGSAGKAAAGTGRAASSVGTSSSGRQQAASNAASAGTASRVPRRLSSSVGAATAATAGGAAKGSGCGAAYRYCVLPGNESVLLREALERRPWWEAALPDSQRWNLWAGLNGQKFDKYELLIPQTQMRAAGARVAGGGAAGAASSSSAASSRRCVNRLQEHRAICTKSGLANILTGLQRAAAGATTTAAAAAAAANPSGSGDDGKPAVVIDTSWIPETYVLAAGPKAPTSSPPLARFRSAFARHAEVGQRVWIAKPTSLNRGNGIEVLDSLDRIQEHLKSRPPGSSLILQKYIENPLLLGGRKFDIRAYVLVGPRELTASTTTTTASASASFPAPVWFHREAYVRTSSTPYDPADLGNRSAHLTNDAVQKQLDTYHTFEDHCKLSLEQLGPAVAQAAAAVADSQGSSFGGGGAGGEDGISGSPAPLQLDTQAGSEAGVWGAMRRCVSALFSAALPALNPRRLDGCWELLGLDFMLDSGGRLALIEVNTSPALFRAGAYLADLLPRLVEEVVQKAVDPLFPPPPPATTTTHPAQQADDAAAGKGQIAGGGGGGRGGAGSTIGGGGVTTGITPLDGFVRVELDARLMGTARMIGPGAGRTAKVAGGAAAAAVAGVKGAARAAASPGRVYMAASANGKGTAAKRAGGSSAND